ncbi:MAG: hypothetical protein IJL05_03045 [Alphaproteobacteria bacterium]|nr:hypothetical protein [Alphaproteobacteria bacterium]
MQLQSQYKLQYQYKLNSAVQSKPKEYQTTETSTNGEKALEEIMKEKNKLSLMWHDNWNDGHYI